MQNAIRITNGGTGRIDHQGRRPLVHRTGYDGPGKKKTAATGGRNAFLTGRFLPIAADYLVEDETGGACVNLPRPKTLTIYTGPPCDMPIS